MSESFTKWWRQVELDAEERQPVDAARLAWEACEKKYRAIGDLARTLQSEVEHTLQTAQLIQKLTKEE